MCEPSHYISRMTYQEQIIQEMLAYCKVAGISPATLGREAGQGGNFFARMKQGKQAFPSTIEGIRLHMEENPPEARKRKSNP